jgi:hypothetical protein
VAVTDKYYDIFTYSGNIGKICPYYEDIATYFSILAIALVLLSCMPALSRGIMNYANAAPLIRHVDDSDNEDIGGVNTPPPTSIVLALHTIV